MSEPADLTFCDALADVGPRRGACHGFANGRDIVQPAIENEACVGISRLLVQSIIIEGFAVSSCDH